MPELRFEYKDGTDAMNRLFFKLNKPILETLKLFSMFLANILSNFITQICWLFSSS
jgi:hypothetical protein